ncbi:trichohyalin [Scaptodrosophila lebanonensis]|uniref:Trichohyalin n=1 Tax=Drosophila lebanonensis TaxID=7225 RepID=A0A6J2UGT9_DROLE|nr:trichohyalin [Scaptodrosophila lebanonensis]
MLSCKAKPVLTSFQIHKKSKSQYPVIVSAQRYDGMLSRANQSEKLAMQEAAEEEKRYQQYLKDGNAALVKLFTGVLNAKQDEKELLHKKENDELKEIEVDLETRRINDRMRKERIKRATEILENMKQGPLALHRALLESEMLHQRKYNEQLNREFAQAADRQQRLEMEQCPETLIPFTSMTEEELKAKEKEKALALRDAILQDVETKRQLLLEQKDKELFEGIVEREQCKCRLEEEELAARKLKERKREQCRRAYHDSLKEKAALAERDRVCDAIDDRRNCVVQVAHRNLDSRYNKHVRHIRYTNFNEREARAMRVHEMQQEGKRKAEELEAQLLERHEAEVHIDDERRQCQLEELAKQRRAYQKEEQERAEKKREREMELRRFEMAQRLKNAEANKLFEASTRRKRNKEMADLRKVLYGQRAEFLERKRDELMRISSCEVDPHLANDKYFFQQAADMMKQSKEVGRPLHPIARAVEKYKRDNNISLEPPRTRIQRSQLRDFCWPGYYAQAERKWKEYERRDKCRKEQEADRNDILRNCMRITKMAAEERVKPGVCKVEIPIACMRQTGMPVIESTDSFECSKYVCVENEPPMGPCSEMKTK